MSCSSSLFFLRERTMKYLLLVATLFFMGCGESWEEVRSGVEARDKADITEVARAISLERFGSFTTVVCHVEYNSSTYTGYTDGHGDLQYFYPCLVFAPKYGWPGKLEPTTFTLYCSTKSCQR